MANQLRLRAVLHVQQRQAAVAPAAVGGVAGNNRMVQGVTFSFRPVRLLTFGLVHPGQPPAPRDFRLTRVRKIDGQKDVVGKAVDQR